MERPSGPAHFSRLLVCCPDRGRKAQAPDSETRRRVSMLLTSHGVESSVEVFVGTGTAIDPGVPAQLVRWLSRVWSVGPDEPGSRASSAALFPERI